MNKYPFENQSLLEWMHRRQIHRFTWMHSVIATRNRPITIYSWINYTLAIRMPPNDLREFN